MSLVIMLCCVQPLFAQNQRSYSFSASPQFGFFYGQIEEIVYPSSPQPADLLSQLLWDVKPIYYYGLLLDFSRTRPLENWGFFSTVSFKNGISGISGKMEDRDWMSLQNDALTHYSIHDNETRRLFMADLNAGVSIPLNHFLLFKTYISASYMHFAFSGFDGYGIYAKQTAYRVYNPITEDPDEVSFSGKVINYTQDWLYAAAGVSFRVYFHERFFTDLSFAVSPLVYCLADDEHLTETTMMNYLDYTTGGIIFEPAINVSFMFYEWMGLSAKCSWRYASGARGQSYYRELNGTGPYTPSGEGGAGLSLVDTSLCLTVQF